MGGDDFYARSASRRRRRAAKAGRYSALLAMLSCRGDAGHMLAAALLLSYSRSDTDAWPLASVRHGRYYKER